MIRRPPTSTRTDTLFPLPDALPISRDHGAMRRGCSCAIMVLRCWRAVLVLGGALLRCRAAVLRCRWARGASGGAGVVGFAGFGAAVGPRGVLPGCGMRARPIGGGCGVAECWGDRKSTRLNSSH